MRPISRTRAGRHGRAQPVPAVRRWKEPADAVGSVQLAAAGGSRRVWPPPAAQTGSGFGVRWPGPTAPGVTSRPRPPQPVRAVAARLRFAPRPRAPAPLPCQRPAPRTRAVRQPLTKKCRVSIARLCRLRCPTETASPANNPFLRASIIRFITSLPHIVCATKKASREQKASS